MRWSRSTSNFLWSDWSKFDSWVRAGNVCSVSNLVYFNSWSWQSFVSTCDVLTAIKSLLLFTASLFIDFLVERCVACESRNSDFGWHRFRFSPCLMRWCIRWVQKSQAILALLDSFQELRLSNYCIWCLFFFISIFMKLSTVYAASLCTFVRFEKMIWGGLANAKSCWFFRAKHENEVEAQRSEKLPVNQKCQSLLTWLCRKYCTGYKNPIESNGWF